MRHTILQWLRLAVIAALLVAMLPLAALAQEADVEGEVVAEGFNGPMGVLVDSAGDIWVVDSGTGGDEEFEGVDPAGNSVTGTVGMTSRIVRISGQDGEQIEVAVLPSVNTGAESEGGSRLAQLRGITYVTAPGWHPGMNPATAEAPLDLTGGLLRITPQGEAVVAVPLWQYEQANDVDGELDNHPYGLTATDDGALLVADAGANALYRVNPASRRAKIIAAFEPLPGAFPNPKYGDEMLADPVPTGVTVRDGVIYVSFLTGFPYLPGTAKVVTVAEDGTVADFATGLTMLTDLRTGPDGELYAVQFAMSNEQGPTPDSGALIRVKEGGASEVLVSGLAFPTSLAFNDGGDAYVSVNGLGEPGSGQVLRFANLTAAAGSPLPEVTALPSVGATPVPTEEAAEEAAAEATAEPTEEATEEAMAEATAEATEEATAEATAEVTAEATAVATEEATAEATAEATEEATEEATAEATTAAAEEAVAVATAEATEAPAEEAAAEQTPETLPATGGETSLPMVAAVSGLALVALAGAAFAFRRAA